MNQGLYENTYKNEHHFSFGKNWQDFISRLDENRIDEAKISLQENIGIENIKDKVFLDFGCGSGLFSLAAFLLGAKTVISIDIDDFSIHCVEFLREKYGSRENWKTLKGSALDLNFINSLEKPDIVYSWGVLHHTGDMYSALENVSSLVKEKGLLYLAIYNNNRDHLREGTSSFWVKIKKIYNRSGLWMKKFLFYAYALYMICGLAILGKNPLFYIRNYSQNRGMNWKNDIIDWLGGYPYEYASPDEIINFFGKKNFFCSKLIYRSGIGCSEYLLINS